MKPRSIIIVILVLIFSAIGLILLSRADTASQSGSKVLPGPAGDKRTPERSTEPVRWSAESLRATIGQTEDGMRKLDMSESEIASASEGLASFLAVVADGDANQYLRYYETYGGAISARAGAVADQQFTKKGLPEITAAEWDTYNQEEKFRAILSDPKHRNAELQEIDPTPLGLGFGWSPPLPKGHRIHGMKSAINPPTAGLFHPGADTEWLWIQYKVKLPGIDDAILQVELLYDPAVNAWLPQRASYIAHADHKVPWIVF